MAGFGRAEAFVQLTRAQRRCFARTGRIQVSGSSAGVPKVEAPNIAAVTSTSQVAQAAAKEGVGPEAQPRSTVADLPSIITAEVVGYEMTDAPPREDEPERKKRTKPE